MATDETKGPDRPPPRRKNAELAVSGNSLALPQRFGPYVVEKGLARGGMGAVLLVRHEKLGAPYALKVIPDATLDPAILVRFEREIQALSALSGHPHIVGVHACGVEAGRPWYVMDRVDGENLDKVLTDHGVLPIEAALRLGVQLASALEAAHARGVLHRDMKPANVLVSGDLADAEGRAILCDFGLATSAEGSLTKTGEVLGTPAFCSPEQALGDRTKLGPHTDVFGLGSVLYYAVTGERAFGRMATSAVSALAAVLHDKLKPPREYRPEIPEGFEAILVRALEKEPADRYASARDMRLDLEAVLAGAKGPSARPRSSGRGVLVLAFALLAGAAAAIAGAVHIQNRPPPPAPPPPLTLPPPPPPPIDAARAELEAAIAERSEARLVTADRRMKEAGGAFTLAEDLRSAREVLLAKKPVEAVRRAIGGRIPDDPAEQATLDAFAIEAAGPEEGQDDDRLALIAQEAAKAGLTVAPLVSRLDVILQSVITQSRAPTGNRHLTAKRVALAATSLRRKNPLTDEAAANEPFRLLERPPMDNASLEDRIDHGGPIGPDERVSDTDQIRLLARSNKMKEAAELLARLRTAGVTGERIELADLEFHSHFAHTVEKALERMGPATPDESIARRIVRGKVHAFLAIATKAPEWERAALQTYGSLFESQLPKLATHNVAHYVATNAAVALVNMYVMLNKYNRARAWLARGRIALGGGGRDLTDFWWGYVFRDRDRD